jgi:MFS family permease
MPFMFAGVGVTLPSMGRELAMSGSMLGLFETLYLGTAAALMLPAGRLGDAGDKNSFFVMGMAVFALATMGVGLAPTTFLILVCRVAQGVTVAFIAATNMAILVQSVPRERLGRAMGLNLGAVYVGLSAGPFVAGAITTAMGWRWMYVTSALVALAATVLALRNLPRSWRRPKFTFDWPGALIGAGGLVLLISSSATLGKTPIAWGLAAFGVAALLLFVRIERKAPSPLVSLDILTQRPVLLRALTVQLLAYAGGFGTSFLFSLYLQEAKGWSAGEAGQMLMISPVIMACLAPVAGRLADRVRPQLLAALGVTFIFIGTAAAWMVPATDSLTLLIASLLTHGVGFAFFSSPNMTVIMSSIPPERTSMASALASQMRTLGMVFSMMLITAFLGMELGSEGLDAQNALGGLLSTMRGALGAISILSLLALLTAWRDSIHHD